MLFPSKSLLVHTLGAASKAESPPLRKIDYGICSVTGPQPRISGPEHRLRPSSEAGSQFCCNLVHIRQRSPAPSRISSCRRPVRSIPKRGVTVSHGVTAGKPSRQSDQGVQQSYVYARHPGHPWHEDVEGFELEYAVSGCTVQWEVSLRVRGCGGRVESA
ncbi:hypothetical protein VTI28DRAFT_9256 [Corynascus sepedonium]